MRLKGYDYSRPGAYFITVCTHNRELLFEPLPVQDMVKSVWQKLLTKFPMVQLDEFVVMPNHIRLKNSTIFNMEMTIVAHPIKSNPP